MQVRNLRTCYWETCADLMLSHQSICLIFSVLRPCSGLLATKNNITHWKCQTFKRSTSHCFHIFELNISTTTFLFTIILIAHEAASVKTGRDSDRFSNISLTVCQEALSERLWKTKSDTLCQELTFAHEALVLIPLSGSTFVKIQHWNDPRFWGSPF